MKRIVGCAVTLGLAAICHAGHRSEQWPLREQETIQKTFTLSGDPHRLVVDNLEGYVHVTGVDGTEVRITAHKSIHADSESDLQQGKKEVRLDMTEKPGSVSLYYAATWRCDNGNHCEDHERRFYEVVFDIDVQVPRDARLVVSTVNGGDVKVDKVTGAMEVGNVNGGIDVAGAAGPGTIRTVNGPIIARFSRNPTLASSFQTVNGNIDVYFQPALSADLIFKTLNGDVFTDFDMEARAIPAVDVEQQNGRYVYHSKGKTGARVGQGGPQMSFDTLNGSIRLHQAH